MRGVFGEVAADFDFAGVGGVEVDVGFFFFADGFFLAVQQPFPEAVGVEVLDDVFEGEGNAWGVEVFGEGEFGDVLDKGVGLGLFFAGGGAAGFGFDEAVSKTCGEDDAADELAPRFETLAEVLFGFGLFVLSPTVDHGPESAEEILTKLGGGEDFVVQVRGVCDGAILNVAFGDEEVALEEAA